MAWGPNRVDVFAVWESLEYENFHYVQQKYLHHNYRELKQGDKRLGKFGFMGRPHDTGSGLMSAPSAVRSAEGQHIDIFSVNASGYLQHRWEEYGGKPTAWTQFDISIKPKANDAPAAAFAKTADGRVDLFVRDNADGRLKKRWFNRMKNLQEDNWVDTEGTIYSAPVAVAWYEGTAPKRFDAFAEGANKTLFHSCWIAG